MSRSRLLLFGLALGLVGTPVLADPPTGSRLGSHLRPGPTLTARDQAEGARQIAQCLYSREAKLARAMLLAPSKESADASNSAMRKGRTECLGLVFSNDMVEERVASIPEDILRGMLAEAALEKSRADVTSLQPLPLQPIYKRDWFAITGRHLSVDEMGACMADTNPAAVAALISTGPESKEEGAAFAGLTDGLVRCLRAGTKLQASRQALRAALAEALYQRLNAPAPQAPVEAAKK